MGAHLPLLYLVSHPGGRPMAVRQARGHPSLPLVKVAHTLSVRGVSARIKWIRPRKDSRFIS